MPFSSNTIIFFGALVVAVILHEISHGIAALWFGDDTAKRAGRLTLNPIPHIDPFGSIILPAMGALTGIPVIGWAKPVPVTVSRLRNPRRDFLWVSLAGPASNLLLMAGAALVAHFMARGYRDAAFLGFAEFPLGFRIMFIFAMMNLSLAVFNLLPIPPLDGSAILEWFMPDSWREVWYRYRQYGIIVLFILVFWTGIGGKVITPFIDRLAEFVIS